MNRIVLWWLSTISVVVLLFGYHTSTSSTMATSPSAEVAIVFGSKSGTSSGSAKASGSSTVTGAVASTQRGPVQVKLTMKGAKITGVDVLKYPSGNSQSTELNARVLPILIKETLDAQSAKIDMVSGATVTSTGYAQSLQSALDKAKV